MARKRGADSEATWESLVAAANEALRRDGPAKFSMRKVATLAGHGLGTLQYYFPKKSELFEALLGPSYRELSAALGELEKELDGGRPLEEVAVELTLAFYRAARQRPQISHARMVTFLLAGRMNDAAHEFLGRAEKRIESKSRRSIEGERLRLGLHSISVLALRYAVHPPDELMRLTKQDSLEKAFEEVEAHLSIVARAAAVAASRDAL